MIIYVQEGERLVSTLTNVMTIPVPSGGYIYVDRPTYDQAVVLNTKFGTDMNGLAGLIGATNHTEAILAFYKAMPEPIKVLAPFLGILEAGVQLTSDVTEATGCLSVMSESIDFWKYIKTPDNIRKNVSFSAHIKQEYQGTWERFAKESIPYSRLVEAFGNAGTFSAAHRNAPPPPPPAPAQTVSFDSVTPVPTPNPVAAPSPIPAPAPTSNIFSNVIIPDDQKGDPAIVAMASDPALMASVFGTVDENSDEFKQALAERMNINNPFDADKDKKKAAMSPNQSASPSTAEAKSGKALVDAWGL